MFLVGSSLDLQQDLQWQRSSEVGAGDSELSVSSARGFRSGQQACASSSGWRNPTSSLKLGHWAAMFGEMVCNFLLRIKCLCPRPTNL